jgi:hypothetical protein
MDVWKALDGSPLNAAIKRAGPRALMVVRRGRGAYAPINSYQQRKDNGEFNPNRMPVNWPLNGPHGNENPDAWESLTEWPPA